MKRGVYLIVLAVLFTVACKNEKVVEPQSVGEITFKIGNENLMFSELEFFDASLDFDLGTGRGVYGKKGARRYYLLDHVRADACG